MSRALKNSPLTVIQEVDRFLVRRNTPYRWLPTADRLWSGGYPVGDEVNLGRGVRVQIYYDHLRGAYGIVNSNRRHHSFHLADKCGRPIYDLEVLRDFALQMENANSPVRRAIEEALRGLERSEEKEKGVLMAFQGHLGAILSNSNTKKNELEVEG